MRPRPLGLGNACRCRPKCPGHRASMRPRPLGLGNVSAFAYLQWLAAASMRPRPLGLGNGCSASSAASGATRFNEAEAVGPRKWMGRHTQVLCTRIASMRPRPLGLGNGTRRRRRSNASDASMRPRPLGLGNAAGTLRGHHRGRDASMRPRPLGLGNEGLRRPWRASFLRFNEAEAVGPRKCAQQLQVVQVHPGLQ